MKLSVAIMTACVAVSGTATAWSMNVYDNQRCRQAAIRFAALHGLRSMPLIPPCIVAPCTVQGVQITHHGQYGVASLKRYFAADPETRTCSVEKTIDPKRYAQRE